ncbi:hypothetical protein FACS1894111_07750 [Clostridia bacterium]|nr:hypothetical protein FACS1894111_07750 [Clostridia bacterium]
MRATMKRSKTKTGNGKRTSVLLLALVLMISVLAGCGSVKPNAVGATLDETVIPLGFLNFMAKYQQATYDGYFGSYYGTDMWKQDIAGDGSTMEQSMKQQIIDQVEILYLLDAHQGDYGVSISEEETAAMTAAAQAFLADNDKKAIRQIGATQEYITEMLRLDTIQQKMRAAMDAEVDTNVSDAEAAQRTFSYVKVDKNSKKDADGKAVDYTDEEKAALDSEMAAFDTAAKADFDTAAADKGYSISAYSYGTDESSMDAAVITAANALKESQVSDLITTDTEYYVLRLDSALDVQKTTAKKDSILTQRKDDHYTEVTDGYKEGVSFTVNEKEWAKVRFTKLFEVVQKDTGTDTNTDTGTDTGNTP